jgi:plastocyanin
MAIRGAGSRGAGVVSLVATGFLAVGVAVAGGAPVKASDFKFRRFNQRGTFRYSCRFHRSLGMTGKVVVK